MLLHDPVIDSLRWSDTGKPPFDGDWVDVSDEAWAVERAIDENLGMPEAERHLAYLRDLDENMPRVPLTDLPDDPYWGGL
jgi:hypothetical protein